MRGGSTLPGLPSFDIQDRLQAQCFGPRPMPRQDQKTIRAGSNITLVWDACGVTVSSTGGGSAGDSDQVILPEMAFRPHQSLPGGFAGGGLTGTYPNPDVVPERLLGGLLPYLPRQAKPPDLRAGTNITLTRDAVGVTIAASGGGAGLTLTDFVQDLGASRSSGTFDLTGLSGLTAGKNVLVVQTSQAIAAKGNARDEPEMDQISLSGYVVDASTIRVYWNASGVVVGSYAFAYQASA